ncbi:DUF2802 domain-containing protein [Ectothiorhodospiraceae bacterium BW-2]|nr:DUF2802 domain-containing protein [Ectothiorhodospiraceae bacterium BW-2]
MTVELLVSALLWLILAAVALFLYVRLRYTEQQLDQQQQRLEQLQTEVRGLGSAGVKMGEQMSALDGRQAKAHQQFKQQLHEFDQRLATLHEKQFSVTRSESDEPSSSFEQAVKLARKGATVEELTEICNITRGEADLIAMMQRYEQSPVER